MSEFSNALSVSAHALQAQATRLRHVSENISNADTPGYRRKSVSFETMRGPEETELLSVGRVQLDKSALDRVFDPAHPLADDSGHYEGSNVDLMLEIADAREAQRSYEANLKMFDQTRQMSAGLMDLLRK
ncbi:flagellar basal body rod protein FlgC [Sedimentitalea todarodis]|uniref:Flagellar basal body rod protein FlgB n=1 Tax=Sedimentitalea todarodis TaxID=1631240 RepID=A0ABU3VK67_9RHOB|nr:flagellar basal body rod protein FlgC [Sedimentitalea todarodis]MDU9006592.1 flagellar basal body rod protein FlgC [Sedimentitalea todarodis]